MSCAGNHDESRACDHDAAFRDYVLTRGSALLRMATMLTGNRADAEDLVQAALAKTYLAWGKINDHAALDAYVRRAMVNTHISWWRRRRLEEFPTDELPDQAVADHARESDMAEVVRRALDRLPQRMRTAVMLRYFEDMTEPEIAAALGISLGTVKSTVSRAVAKLRIDAELGEDSGARLPVMAGPVRAPAGSTAGSLTRGTIRYAGQAPRGGGSVRSTMMDLPLTITSIMRYGTSVFGDGEVVTWTGDGTRRRTYAEAGRRAARLANALRGLGVDGDQRVGTFMWNNAEHLEAYLAIPSMGAVLHTLNIRLAAAEVGYIATHAEDQVVIVDASLVPKFAEILPQRADRQARDRDRWPAGRDARNRPAHRRGRAQLRGSARRRA